MQQVNVHKTKLFALLEAGFAIVGLFLAWTIETYPNQQQQGFGMNAMVSVSQNGFNSWGWLALVGVAGVVFSTLLAGDRTKDYDTNNKNIAMLSFVAIAAGAIIYYFILNGEAKKMELAYQQQGINYTAKPGMGIWLTFAAGLIGLAWVSGVLNKLGAPATPPAAPPAAPLPPTPPATPSA